MATSEHISKQFDADLENVRSQVLQMGGLVEGQLMAAIDTLMTGSEDLISRVIDTERRVNTIEKEIDDAITHVVARRQPAASDLRLIMGVSKIVTDLERIGDEAEKIARMARQIYGRGALSIPRSVDVRQSGHHASQALRRVLDAMARLDTGEAEKIIAEDKLIDTEFRAILRQLITYMMEDPRTISTALDIVWAAKAIERVGDHAKNIAEQVIYVVNGTDVRHTRASASTTAGDNA
ncbi:MAG: phosphate signaling complex protein PhoU [Betaproteobacteria bacterium]|nr:phosphate signaling complex protein PhoU [Betaproteobacteria bacterium]